MLNLAFLYNVRHVYPDPDDPQAQLETDFDDPETIEHMLRYLKELGINVIPIEMDDRAYLELYEKRNQIDLVFNYSEGLRGRDRECHLPAMLEMLGLPYTGPSPLTQALVLNKARTKEILAYHGIPVLPHQVFRTGREKLVDELKFPLIVKPIAQGSSAGITNASVVHNQLELENQVNYVISNFKQEALVEPFLTGREFSVPMLGNPPRILPFIESDHSVLPGGLNHLDSLEVKWIFEEEGDKAENLKCPANVPKELEEKINKICLEAWRVLELADFCRVDIRCDAQGQPYFLEVNSPSGLIPPEISRSYFPTSAKVAGLEYGDLLREIINAAITRHSLEKI
ncbi:MAG TPA: ATP-grasp domain-containing protein [Patescibacteria group bacterium]|nr:ATP-grasp domain-containing protein [Patescibacteria group bacterium]